jgi:TP901 family phage tail tape measure protein
MQSIQLPVTQTGLEQSIQQALKNAGKNAQINLGTNSRQINALAQPLGRITGQADEFTKSMEAANARVFAFGASVGIINGVSKAFTALVKNTIATEKALTDINVNLNKSSAELDKFGNSLFDLAKSTGQSFQTVADGALELSRQGLDAVDVVKRLNDALILSRLSGLDAQQSVEGLTAAINSFSSAGVTSEQILNKLVVVSQKYAVSERDLIEGIKRSASVAEQAGVSLDELIGVITTVQERTARGGAVIGNAFKTIFSKIQDKGALEDLQNLGIQVTDAAGKILPATSILQNLAKEFEGLSQIQQTDIAKKLGGVYQLSNLLAAVKDLGSEESKYADIVKKSQGATTQAYQKNVALNQTLDALINKVSVSAEQLGATLGKIGLTDNLKGVLNFFSELLDGIQNILGEESGLGSLVRGLAKGIGNLITGPGLALFGAIILKLSKDLVQFGFSSLKGFFGIGKAAKEIADVERSINTALATNIGLQQKLFSLEGNRAGQLKVITDALIQQEAVIRRSASISKDLASPSYGLGVRATTQGLRVPEKNAAGGYMPAVAKESSDISRGVGGARSGDKPVIIPNFNFGGGKKGSIVAHTGEYAIPNFAGSGGTAIFNRNMVQKMGLPAGAKKITASGGFIPNFVDYTQYSQSRLSSLVNGKNFQKKLESGSLSQEEKSILEALNAKTAKFSNTWNGELYPSSVMLLPNASSGQNISHSFKEPYGGYDMFVGKAYGINPNLSKDSKFKKMLNLDSAMDESLASAANFVLQQVKPDIDPQPESVTSSNIKSLISASGGAGALGSIRGALFEAVTNSIIKGVSKESIGAGNNNTLDVEFGASNKRNVLEEIFGLPKNHYDYGDYKNSLEQKDKYVRQVIDNLSKSRKSRISRAVSGYIPNFADPLKDAINREMAAGVPASQIYIDKNQSLKSASNPMGLMVANRRDEPMGGQQGINRAIKEGRNPKTYGAAGGFVPNYAENINFSPYIGKNRQDALAEETKQYGEALIKNTEALIKAKKELDKITDKNSAKAVALTSEIKALKDNEKTLKDSSIATRKVITEQTKGILGTGRTATLRQAKVTGSTAGGSKDMLGTIFAVQGAMTALSGATEGATSGFAKLTNGISSAASTATTFLFAGQGLAQSFGGAEKGIGKVVGKLGVYGAVAAGLYTGFKELTKYLDSTNPSIQKASESMLRVSDAASKAAINLNTLNPAQQEIVKKQSADLIAGARKYETTVYTPTMGTYGASNVQTGINYANFEGVSDQMKVGFENLISQAAGVGVDTNTIYNEMRSRFQSGSVMTSSEVQDLSNLLSNQISEIAKKGSPTSIIQGLTEEQKKKYASITPKEMEDAISNRTNEDGSTNNNNILADLQEKFFTAGVKGDVARQESIRKTIELLRDQQAAEENTQKEAVSKVPVQLRETIKNIQREKLERESIRKIDQDISKTRYNSSVAIAGIEADLTLSASQRAIKTLEVQSALEKQTAELEAQKSIQEELNKLVAEFTDNPAFKLVQDGEKIARTTLQGLTTNENAKKLLGAPKDEQENAAIDLVKESLKGTALAPIESAAVALADQLLKALNLQEKANQSLEDANKEREKSKNLEIVKNKIQEQNNRLLQEAQSRISAIADNYTMNAGRVAGEIRLNSPRQELALAQYNATTQETDPRKLREDQRKIIDEFFQKQVNLQAEQSRIEAEADFIRNLKVEDNIKSIDENTKALKDLYDSLTKEAAMTPENVAAKNTDLTGVDTVHLRKLIAAEVGSQGENAQAALLATIFNRAEKQGKSINDISKNERYYAPLQNPQKFMATPPISQDLFDKILKNPYINSQYLHNATNNAEGRAMMKKEGVNFESSAAIIGNEYFYNKPGELSGAKSTGITSQKASLRTAEIGSEAINKARELSSIQDATTINEKALEYAKTVATTEESAQGLAEQIKNLAIRMQQIGKEKTLSGEENTLKNMAQSAQDVVRSLAYLDKVSIEQSMQQAPSTFSEGMANGFLQIQADGQNFAYLLGKDIPKMFAEGMSNAINSAIEGSKSIGDALKSAAYEFVKAINQKLMGNLVDKAVGGLGNLGMSFFQTKAAGGMITGGSGSKDDVPAMLMGGEFVMNKKAVQKYGPDFLNALNSGSIGGYAKGGPVQRGPQGNFYTPGQYGSGAISGSKNLLDFATQSYSSGKRDEIINSGNFASINLEAESARLTNFGRQNNPAADALRSAKEEAFSLYLRDYEAKKEEQKKQKEQSKALKNQLLMLGISVVGGSLVKSAATGFGNAYTQAQNLGQGYMSSLGAGVEGIWSGYNGSGGLANIFSDTAFTPRAKIVGDVNGMPYAKYRATGGMIPPTSGIDTVSTMLTGGEFVMNRAAAQNIGAGNLQSLNSGAKSLPTEEKSEELNDRLISKLDELIEASGAAGNITINVEGGSGKSSETSDGKSAEGKQQLARQIRDAVLKVIQEEKRLGGQLRRGM